jgi:spore maturation protein CgeB
MDLYFPESHVFYFETMQELQYLIKTLAGKPPERIREELREIVCDKHSHTVRAAQVLEILSKVL